MKITEAQSDMREGYLGGAPGVAASGLVWLVAGGLAGIQGSRAGVMALFFGGMLIHPVGVLVARRFGRSGIHRKDNPLASLAFESTAILLLGVALAFALSHYHVDLFFPVMLVVIGGRYLTFQTLYGIRLYWVCGGLLAVLGLGSMVVRAPASPVAILGGLIELAFAAVIFAPERRKLGHGRE